ncbi:unnamed protein product [Cylicocyclus nassatus]|uniref:PAN-3 domain-containing protein n=1 Tax=Cylicocyclus nassatus TaxID=53992 RepID=A0AA36M733_CYLNA|nr:unnamed protein product [Cylicocyclus nassatus]
MKWTVLILLLTQAGWTSSCVFDRVEEVKGKWITHLSGNINDCFAACYEDVRCIGIRHQSIGSGTCEMLEAGNTSYKEDPIVVAYSLLRDDVDPTCQKFVNF